MCEPGSHESHRPREPEWGSLGSAEPVYSRRRPRRHRCAGTDDDRTPRGRRGRYARTEWAVKARNHSRVASALPHSEGIAYKPPCGEIAVCPRVGRMRPTSDDGPGHYNPDPSEGLWGGGVMSSKAVHDRVRGPTQGGKPLGPRGARRVDANRTSDSACREQA